jgi:phosphomevalonate kinase
VRAHGEALGAFGESIGAPVVTDALAALARALAPLGAAVKPSGAGGGDVSLLVARDPAALREAVALAERHGFGRVALDVDAHGVHIG